MRTLNAFWCSLPSSARATVRTVLTIAINGGASALSFAVVDPDHFNLHELKHLGAVFAIGAAVAVINWIRQQPWKTDAPTSLGHNAGV